MAVGVLYKHMQKGKKVPEKHLCSIDGSCGSVRFSSINTPGTGLLVGRADSVPG